MYDFVHYHPQTHEVMGVARGTAKIERWAQRPRVKVIPDKQPVADNTRKGAVMKRSQLAIKTMGKKTFTSGTRKAGQQPERNLDHERGLRAG